MSSKRRLLSIILPTIAMLALILDAKTAATAASEGILFCLRTVIPSLFPFFILSTLLTNNLFGQEIPILRFLGKLCRMPKGSECLFLIGILGGYPVGAQSIGSAYRNKQIEKHTAHRLLGFCSNAGPAFIFGICADLFQKRSTIWILWAVHIFSAVITGRAFPLTHNHTMNTNLTTPINFQQALTKSIKITANVCGTIVIFRIIINFIDRWFLWCFPQYLQFAIAGFLELANGIYILKGCTNESIRFVLSATMLGFGGICVYMQTLSATEELGPGYYLSGKLIQSMTSFSISILLANYLFEPIPYAYAASSAVLFVNIILIISLQKAKIAVAFSRQPLYNTQKQSRELQPCCFERK